MWFFCSTAAAAIKQLEGPSDLPQSSGVQQSELMATYPPTPANAGKHWLT